MVYSVVRKWFGVELVEVTIFERLVATVGGGLSILALVALTLLALPEAGATAVIASMGASAVLLFGVPHGQLSQPWPVLAGHGISAIIGVACARFIAHPHLAVACAVGLAIGAMHQFKCIHPPGGATAFTAVMGGKAIQHLGFKFVLFPVLTNAAVMVLLAVLFNSLFKWRRYPAIWNRRVAVEPSPSSTGEQAPRPTHDEVMAALKSLDSFVDITEEDLIQLTQMLGHHTNAQSDSHHRSEENVARR